MIKKIEYNLLPHQIQFVNANKRYILNSGGVGSGKTYSLVLRTLRLCQEHPGIFILVGAQTYPLLRDTTLREFLNIVPSEAFKSYNKTNQHFKFHNGSEVIFRSFDDPNKLKSLNLGACAVEEMTDIPEEIFKMLQTRMRQLDMPCCIFGATNPGTFGNWVYKYFIEDPLDNSETIYSISADNQYLPEEYLKDLQGIKKRNPEYYERMVMGKWGVLEGLVYNFPMAQRITEFPNRDKMHRYIGGIDFGYTHPAAILIIGIRDNNYYVVDEIYQHKMTSGDQVKRVKEKMLDYNVDCFYCDSSRPEMIEDFRREGIPAIPAIKDVFEGIMHVKSMIGAGQVYVNQECTFTLREFDSYIWDPKNTVKEVPLKINDDCMDALRYALYSSRSSGVVFEYDLGDDRETSKMDF